MHTSVHAHHLLSLRGLLSDLPHRRRLLDRAILHLLLRVSAQSVTLVLGFLEHVHLLLELIPRTCEDQVECNASHEGDNSYSAVVPDLGND